MISPQYELAMTAAERLLESGSGEYNPNVYVILEAHHAAIREVAFLLDNYLTRTTTLLKSNAQSKANIEIDIPGSEAND